MTSGGAASDRCPVCIYGLPFRQRDPGPAMRFQSSIILLAAALFLPGMAGAKVSIDFIPHAPEQEGNARVYQAIWARDGDRIVKALEARTCMPFSESRVAAIVADAPSHSGGPEHPMRLRAGYFRAVKQSTLVHELGHRHLWQFPNRLDGIDGHRTLYLILDRVWADVWGEQFARDRIRDESSWLARYDYSGAWRWARALAPDERMQLWNRLLAINGFPASCRGARA